MSWEWMNSPRILLCKTQGLLSSIACHRTELGGGARSGRWPDAAVTRCQEDVAAAVAGVVPFAAAGTA